MERKPLSQLARNATAARIKHGRKSVQADDAMLALIDAAIYHSPSSKFYTDLLAVLDYAQPDEERDYETWLLEEGGPEGDGNHIVHAMRRLRAQLETISTEGGTHV